MATNPVDPIDDEIRRALANPKVRARLDRARERAQRGDLPTRSNDAEARRVLGLPIQEQEEEPE